MTAPLYFNEAPQTVMLFPTVITKNSEGLLISVQNLSEFLGLLLSTSALTATIYPLLPHCPKCIFKISSEFFSIK